MDETRTAHLDEERTLARIGEDRDLLGELYKVFKEDAPAKLETLRQAVEAEDLASAMKRAHSIKGAAAAIGAERCRSLSEELEYAAEEGDLAAAQASLESLDKELAVVLDLLEEWQG